MSIEPTRQKNLTVNILAPTERMLSKKVELLWTNAYFHQGGFVFCKKEVIVCLAKRFHCSFICASNCTVGFIFQVLKYLLGTFWECSVFFSMNEYPVGQRMIGQFISLVKYYSNWYYKCEREFVCSLRFHALTIF